MQYPKFSKEDLIHRVKELEKENAQLREEFNSEKSKKVIISDNKKILLTQALLNASKIIPGSNSFHEAAEHIFNELKNLLKADAGYVALLNKATGMNEVVHLEPGSQECTVDPNLPMPVRGYRATVYESKEVKYHNDFSNSKWIKLMPKGHTVLRNIMFVPMLVNGEAVGLIGLSNKPGGFTDEDAEMAKEFGILAVIALTYSKSIEENIQAEKKLKESEKHFRSMTEDSSLMIWESGLDAKCNYFNKRWLEFRGREMHEEIGDGWIEGLHPDDFDYCVNGYLKAFKKREKFELEYRLKDAKGNYRWILDLGSPRFKEDGSFYGYIGSCIDITEKHLIDEIQKEKEELYNELFEKNKAVKLIVDPADGKIVDANSAAANFYGYPLDVLTNMKIMEINQMSEKELFDEMQKAKSEIRMFYEFVHKMADGSLKYVDVYTGPITFKGKKLLYSIIYDITEQKRAEQELTKAKEKELEDSLKFKRLFDQVKDPIYIYNPDNFEILEANKATSEVYGYTEEELVGMSCLEFSAEVQESVAVGEKLIKEGQAEVKFRHHKKKDGTDVFIEINGYKVRVNKKDVVFIVCKDITDKVKAEQKLIKAKTKAEENEAKFNVIAEYTYDWETYYDSKANIIFVNSAFEKITGYSKDAFRLKKIQFKDFVHKEDLTELERILEDIFKGKTIDNYSFRIINKNGAVVFIEICSQGVFDSNNGLIGIRTSQRDITDRTIAEQELINSEEKFRLIVNALPQFISYCSADFKYLYVNKTYEKEFGLKQEEIFNKPIMDVIGEKAFNQAQNHLQKVIKGETVRYYEKFVYKNGKTKHIDGQLIPHFNADKKVVGYYGVLSDISPYIEARELLEKSEKEKAIILESMSEMLTYCDKDLNIIWANKAAREFRQKLEKDIEGKKCYQAWHNSDTPCENCSALKAISSGKMEENELKTIDDRLFRLKAYPVKNANSQIEGVVEFGLDITEQKKKDNEQKKIYNLYRTLASNLPEINVFLFDTDKRILIAEGNEFRNYKKSDFEGKLINELFFDEKSISLMDNMFNSGLEGKKNINELKFNGSWYEQTVVPIKTHNNKVIGGLVVSRNITEQKNATTEIENSKEKLKQLSAYSQQLIENERSHVAREIHDELGQNLTFIKLNLALIGQKLSKPSKKEIELQFKNIYEVLDKTIQKVKKISSELRPKVIDDLGIVPAIEWHISEFIKQTGLKCTFNYNNDDIDINNELAINIFRIIQEALTNCVKHAKATEVNINFKELPGKLIIEIQDNGKGMKQTEIHKPNSLGILGMKERVELFNGTFSIKGSAKNGTIIKIIIPIKK